MAKSKKSQTPAVQTAAAAAKHKAETEAADAAFRADQSKTGCKVAQLLLAESQGGTAAALAVGDASWEYVNAELIRANSGKLEVFTAAVGHLKADISARMVTDSAPNISRYLGYAALARLWDRSKLLQLPKSFLQEACPLVYRDESAPGLEYQTPGPRGMSTQLGYQWQNGVADKAVKLLDEAAAAVGTCNALTVDAFAAKRKAIWAVGQGRHNQTGKGKGKGGKAAAEKGKAAARKAAEKAAEKLLSLILLNISSYAESDTDIGDRVKGLKAIRLRAKEAYDQLVTEAAAAAKGKPQKAAA